MADAALQKVGSSAKWILAIVGLLSTAGGATVWLLDVRFLNHAEAAETYVRRDTVEIQLSAIQGELKAIRQDIRAIRQTENRQTPVIGEE